MRHITLLLMTLITFTTPAMADSATALFAGGCFWCMESAYEKQKGVTGVVSGFTGGTLKNPTYSGNHEGHFEAIEVTYDPSVVSYQELLDLFWRNIDPFDDKGQFCDKGPSYRSAIFPATAAERKMADQSKAMVAARFGGQEVHTEILEAGAFWPVEEHHQDYYLKNPVRYKYYRWNCGRDQRLQQLWGSEAATHSGN
jgi:peptide-methionine (S)-S-oxide reductase